MDHLRTIARALYEAGNQEFKNLAHDFFNSHDTDGDGTLDIKEFLELIDSVSEGKRRLSYPQSLRLFNKLDTRGNGTLDFFEVMTFYYIIKSGREFCDACGELIAGVFFTCGSCYLTPVTYNACLICYNNGRLSHHHDDFQFLDNFTMLSEMRLALLEAGCGNGNQMSSVQPSMSTPSTSNSIAVAPVIMSRENVQPSTYTPSTNTALRSAPSTYIPYTSTPSTYTPSTYTPSTYTPYTSTPYTSTPYTSTPSTSNVMIIAPRPRMDKLTIAFRALELALAVGVFCTIM